MRSNLLIALTILAALLFAACAPPPADVAPTAEPTAVTDTAPEMMDIVDTAIAAGSFNTLVAAVDAADLVDTLKGDGPFTVFAPTDEAFAALPDGTVEALLEDIPTLTNILLYHVDYAIASLNVRGDDLSVANHHIITFNGDGDGQSGGGIGGIETYDISGHDVAGDHVIKQDVREGRDIFK